jgi:chromate transporter
LDSRPRPRSPADLFWSFTWLALQGFGGVLAVVQRELVEKKRWMTNEEFVEDWAVAQIMPGPNVVNLSVMIGDRHFGLRGAWRRWQACSRFPAAGAGGGAGVCASLPATRPWRARCGAWAPWRRADCGHGLQAGGGAAQSPAGPLAVRRAGRPHLCGMALLRWPLAWVLPVLGGVACVLTWRKIAP